MDTYLTDEIRNEGLVRNLPGFARFLDVAGILSNSGGYFVRLFYLSYSKKIKRDLITATPKFYLFDVGIANYLAQQFVTSLSGMVAGKSFEHYILMELIAYSNFSRKKFDITYWRTKTGLEVDFILGNAVAAIEVKISDQVHQQDLKGLIAFCEEHPTAKGIVVSQDKNPRQVIVNDKLSLSILPWKIFLKKLWENEVI